MNFSNKKIKTLITFIVIAILIIFGRNFIIFQVKELAKEPVFRVHLINIAKILIPLKNSILLRNIDDKIALLNASGSCIFCDLSQGKFKENDLKEVDLRYANLSNTNLSNINFSGTNLRHVNFNGANMTGVDLTNKDLTGANLTGVDLRNKDLTGANLTGVDLSNKDLTGANLTGVDLTNKDLTGANLTGVDLTNKDLTGANLTGVDLTNKDLTGANLTGVDLTNKDLTGANLTGVDLSNKDLTGTILTFAWLSESNLTGVDLSNKDLTGANLSGVDLSNKDLTGTILTYAKILDSNLTGVDLTNKDLTGANLSGVDLSNKDLTGTILITADLSETNLDGVDLSNKDLTGTNLTGVNFRMVDLKNVNLSGSILRKADLSNKDLTGTILSFADLSEANLDGSDLSNVDLTGAILNGVEFKNVDLTQTLINDFKKIEITIKKPSNSNWLSSNEIQNLNVTRYDLGKDIQYVATKEGFLFQSKNNEPKLVLDLNSDAQFPFVSEGSERGLLGIASRDNLVYVSYTSIDLDGTYSLVVDEYSKNFMKVRNIIKIGGFNDRAFGGSLSFDSNGKLYLSVGDGGGSEKRESDFFLAQDLSSKKGKILRLDISTFKHEPEIVAYGIRNPYGTFIDSKDRMFILQCGRSAVEAAYFLNDLYKINPVNFGWPIFEGSIRMRKTPLMFEEITAPIFETKKRPGCLTAGIYLDEIESFLLGDFFGTIRLLKQKENGEWYLLHENKREKDFIWGFGLDKKTKKIFIAPNNFELEISFDQVKIDQKKS